MPGESSPQHSREASTGEFVAFAQWLLVGAAGAALWFVVAEQAPQRIKLFVFFPILVESLAAWGLGRWGAYRSVRAGGLFLLSSGLIIAACHLLTAVKTHRDGVRTMLAQKRWQQPVDPVSAKFKEFVETAPEDESPEAREQRLAVLAAIERGEAMHKEQRDYLTFYGFLANRIPKEWGRWPYPWPAVFWGAEVLIGSTVGAWLAWWTLRAASPRAVGGATPSSPASQMQGANG
jgi:hypothetical protein